MVREQMAHAMVEMDLNEDNVQVVATVATNLVSNENQVSGELVVSCILHLVHMKMVLFIKGMYP